MSATRKAERFKEGEDVQIVDFPVVNLVRADVFSHRPFEHANAKPGMAVDFHTNRDQLQRPSSFYRIELTDEERQVVRHLCGAGAPSLPRVQEILRSAGVEALKRRAAADGLSVSHTRASVEPPADQVRITRVEEADPSAHDERRAVEVLGHAVDGRILLSVDAKQPIGISIGGVNVGGIVNVDTSEVEWGVKVERSGAPSDEPAVSQPEV